MSEEALRRAIWECKIGRAERDTLPDGCDQPLRAAVERAYRELTGVSADFIFSGWGGKLTEYERAALSEGQAPEPVAQEPVGFMYADDFDELREDGMATIYKIRQTFLPGHERTPTALYAGMDAARAKAINDKDHD